TVIQLGVGLPVRNPSGLDAFIADVSDPSSANYRKYLSSAAFAATFSPTQADYNTLTAWATSKGLTVTAQPNRLYLNVSGTAAQISQALFVNFDLRRRPDGTQFYALDREPSLDLALPVLHVSGLDTLTEARRLANVGGSGLNGNLLGKDFRTIYASCTSLDGSGQTVGLWEVDGF